VDGLDSWIMSGVAGILGVAGLFLAAGADDGGIYLFGLLLFAFAILFIFSRIKGAFDAAESRGPAEEASAR
jgi:hypothetical protein